MVARLLQYVQKNTENGLIIRNHPNDLIISEPCEGVYFSSKDESIATILHASDVVITQGSTVGIEANILGKTVFQYIDSKCTKPLVDQEAMGVAKKFNTADSIIQFLDQNHLKLKQPIHFDVWPSTLIANYIICLP
jgi:CDP-glycerol glycerophosphotransferase (TagB/SpsB family)